VDLGEYEAAGLYDPAAPEAAERVELLKFLVAEGCTIEEMVAANERGRLFALAGDRQIIPDRDQYSLAQIADEVGMPIADVRAVWRALGMVAPADDDPVASPDDVAAIRVVSEMSGLLGMSGVLGIARVIAASLSRIAEATSTAVRGQLPGLALEVSGSEAATARTFAGVAGMVPRMAGALDAFFRHHLEAARMNWERSDSRDLLESGGVRVAVGFADLSGFTGLTEGLSMPELTSLLTVFEEVADDIVRDEEGRVVKFIGDAVMYVAHDAGAGVRIAQALVEAARIRGMDARAGVTVGVVLPLEGDFFGPVVNLAARLVAMAQPGEVLVTDEVVARLGDEVRAVGLGPRSVRGFTQAIEVASLR
jgi:class 3 adenylate cyclase